MLNFDRGVRGEKGFIISDNCFCTAHLNGYETIFCQGNGYLGQRAALEERYFAEKRNLFVTGTFDRFHPSEVTELPNLPDFTNMTLIVNGDMFRLDQGTLLTFERWLNLKTGEHSRRCVWRSPGNIEVALCFRRFVSMKREHVIGFRVELTCPHTDCEVTIRSGIDGTVTNSGTQHMYERSKRVMDGNILMMETGTVQSDVICHQYAAHRYNVEVGHRQIKSARRMLMEAASCNLEKQKTAVLEKICCIHTSRDFAAIDGLAEIRTAIGMGYEALLDESSTAWAQLWADMDVAIDSCHIYDQVAVRFALYHLNIMCKKDDYRVGIGAKGLSGEGYKGHSFWDTEIFILPYFVLTQPAAACTLLQYRYHTLHGALDKARAHGYQGALYPWESAWDTDGEVTPRFGDVDPVTGQQVPILTGELEQHVSADIAYAVWQYYSATKDEAFMERYGRQIILETARFWASRAQWDKNKQQYVILDVIGPDEYKEHVNNSAFTNYMAHFNMMLALQFEESPAIRQVAENLYLPAPDKEGIIEQHDGFAQLEYIDLTPFKQAKDQDNSLGKHSLDAIKHLQVIKQADVLLLLLLLPDLFDEQTKRANLDYYEPRTIHHSSLSKAAHSMLAHKLGRDEMAYSFFRATCGIDLPLDIPSALDGIHSASLGSVWQCAVFGFGGVCVKGEKLYIDPRLPENWNSLSFRVIWHGQPLYITIDGENNLQIINRGNAPVRIVVKGKEENVAPQ